MTRFAGQKLLVAPLDWGLGHATRCIPIIKALLNQNCKIWLAGEGAQEVLLRKEFPELPFLPLEGYRVGYSASRMTGKILLQVPKIINAIKTENRWLKEKVKELGFNAVISDNRYGLCHENIPCIFITHQLYIKTGLGKWSEWLLQNQNYKLINCFSECWVPDEEGENNLAGELSHPGKMPAVPVKYIGPLSRFVRMDSYGEKRGIIETKNHLLILLSGPEPQRTIFEKKIFGDLKNVENSVTVVRGLPQEKETPVVNERVTVFNHLASYELQKEIEKAEWVIGRCGYSTVMDLAALQKKSILVPTPGQAEQEYLAKHLMKNKIAFCVSQKEFSLEETLKQANQFMYLSTAQ